MQPIMSDENPEQYTEYVTQDGPGSADAGDPSQEHPEQEAHGGSMAPGLVDDAGRPTADLPETD